MVRATGVAHPFTITKIERYAEALGLREQRQRIGPRHVPLEKGVDFRLVADVPARKERGQRHLREDDELGTATTRFAHEGDQAPHHGLSAISTRDGAELGGGNGEMAQHRRQSRAAIVMISTR